MKPADFLAYQVSMLNALCPPIQAIGLGGSGGACNNDSRSDLDLFLLIDQSEFFAFVEQFPRLVRHPWPPVVGRRRGFVPEFGYQFSFVYPGRQAVDYHLNCPGSLIPTPMARKTKVLMDHTGTFTNFHATVAGADPQLDEAWGEVLVELLRIRKYAERGELLTVLHRFERLRLVLLALERHLRHAEPYIPHDADKWVGRDLSPSVNALIASTFAPCTWPAAGSAFAAVYQGVTARLAELTSPKPPEGYWELCAELRAEIGELIARRV